MKKLLIRIVVVAVLLVGMNWVYAKWFYKKDLVEHSDIVELAWQVTDDSCRIVYVGESSNITFGLEENNHRKISEYTADYFPAVKMGDMTKSAAHAQTYYYLLKQIPKDAPVETVVVTMNLRSFGASWIYSRLETALRKQLVLMQDYPPLLNRFLLALKAYPIHTEEEWSEITLEHWKTDSLDFPYPFSHPSTAEWDSSQAWTGFWNADGTKNQAKTELACHYIKTYAFNITDDNPRLDDFDAIVDLCHKRGWHLVLNLMAENVDKANELVGEDLLFLMRRNRDYLLQRYGSLDDVVVVDNMSLVRDVNFIDQDWTTEHYYEEGRRIVADNVAEALKTFYPDDYVDCDSLQCDFGHFKGNQPSRCIVASNPYASGVVVDSLSPEWGEVDVAFFANPSDSLAALFLSVQGFRDGELVLNASYPISFDHYALQKWDFHSKSIVMDSTFKAAQNVKFFLMNTSEVPVEVSALDVSFHPTNLKPGVKGKSMLP